MLLLSSEDRKPVGNNKNSKKIIHVLMLFNFFLYIYIYIYILSESASVSDPV